MADGTKGVLPDQDLRALFQDGAIRSEMELDSDQIQPASLDLRLSDTVYRVRASFLPGKDRKVADVLQNSDLELQRLTIERGGSALRETGCVYLVPLMESLKLPSGIYGRTNPKSSTGRSDVFTRVVTNKSKQFDTVDPGYSGPLWLEISPRTFPIKIRPGDRLAQLRLRRGKHDVSHEQTVSIDLESEDNGPVGWRAKRHSGVIDLRAIGQHAERDFWEPLYASGGRLVLDPEEFYILASREPVKVVPGKAAEMAPIAPELGEFRAHYAGFFDPGFGMNDGGSRAVLEVRSRDVPFILEHGQPVAKLIYEAMASKPSALYGGKTSNYQGQGLKLSKHFGPS